MNVNSANDYLRASGYEVVDPDIFENHEAALASARLDGERTGYVKALDAAIETFEVVGAESQNAIYSVECVEILDQLKKEYQQEIESGKDK